MKRIMIIALMNMDEEDGALGDKDEDQDKDKDERMTIIVLMKMSNKIKMNMRSMQFMRRRSCRGRRKNDQGRE